MAKDKRNVKKKIKCSLTGIFQAEEYCLKKCPNARVCYALKSFQAGRHNMTCQMSFVGHQRALVAL